MNSLKITLVTLSATLLSACFPPTGQFFGEQKDYLRNDRGVLTECDSNPVINLATGEPVYWGIVKTDAKSFWNDNNLPKGTLYYNCEGDNAVLPKDCQGKPLTTPMIRRYWKKYNLPVGIKEFDCRTGVPKVPKDSYFYKRGRMTYDPK